MLPCNGCAYRRSIPGNCHISCAFAWGKHPDETNQTFNGFEISARARQWFIFPLNYDPVWGPDSCTARAETADPEKVTELSPMLSILSMLA